MNLTKQKIINKVKQFFKEEFTITKVTFLDVVLITTIWECLDYLEKLILNIP